MQTVICIHPDDSMLVALRDLAPGDVVRWNEENILISSPVKTKHKLARRAFAVGDTLTMYGVPVGKATQPIRRGEAVTTENLAHYAAEVDLGVSTAPYSWTPPDVADVAGATFDGVVRADGRVGTANYWLIYPLVFCENRNVEHLRNALEGPLGYSRNDLAALTFSLLGEDMAAPQPVVRPFPNLDGVRIITHNGGCGGTRADARSLCRILSSYADHPNVAGITVFSLGCQNAQIAMFKDALAKQNPDFAKPVLIYEQQQWDSEAAMMKAVLQDTLAQLKEANKVVRQPVSVSHLKIGVKCGGSDGFSGISANPAMGYVSDMVVAVGGSSLLAEFPELCGVEASLIERCVQDDDKRRFVAMMRDFEARALAVGTHFADNPSPGNIRDGLITDAMKSAGAAKKGGTSPIVAVLDYGEQTATPGLSLLCTPGGDVESVTGIVASGANVVLFSTGLGTPTGNPIVPVLKISSNTRVATKLADLIDYDCGPIIEGAPLPEVARGLFDMVVATAGGKYQCKADRLQQYDFIFWKRDISL